MSFNFASQLRINRFSNSYRPAFKAEMNHVRYVVVDGHIVEDKAVIEEVSKALVKTAKNGKAADESLRLAIKKAVPEYSLTEGFQNAKFLKLNSLGKEFNIIMGAAASKLKHIWSQAGVSLNTKKQQAGELISRLIRDPKTNHIAIEAMSQKVKGKIKYIIKNIYITV